MGRGQGRGYRRGGRGTKPGRGSNNKTTKKKTKLEEFWFYIGSATQASNYEETKDFILNYILTNYSKGGKDIYEALSGLEEIDTRTMFYGNEDGRASSSSTIAARLARRRDVRWERHWS